jgi:glycosyltransferase involved in cell wall biosynthesis
VTIVIATDAWLPQVNGVVRSLGATVEGLRKRGLAVEIIEPSTFPTVPCPSYPEIRLALGCSGAVARRLDSIAPSSVHIATEGPVGLAARRWCLRNRRAFTTSLHSRFPDYVALRTGLPERWLWAAVRRFHQAAERIFVSTPTLARELGERGFPRAFVCPLGVDLDQFRPDGPGHPKLVGLPRPILLSVGRVAVEKNLEAFLDCPVPGSKVVVGDGPALARLKQRYGEVAFLGAKAGEELAALYRSADLFVFPSRTDTFGLVNIEALACGLPVAAFSVAGPLDILGRSECGVNGGTRRLGALDDDLAKGIGRALSADRQAAAAEALHYGWDRCVTRFIEGLVPALERHDEPRSLMSPVAQWSAA